MRKEFNNLVELLSNLQLPSPIGMAIMNLEHKIDEVEKRIECARRSAKEINETISKYTEDVDKHLLINMTVSDHDLIQNSSDDVRIALNLIEDMCIKDNWYNLFSTKEELKPIAVGRIEYEFPEEVYTIGNVDNTEIIGDVYESQFEELCDFGTIICEGDDNFKFGKANYIIKDDSYITLVVSRQIDLSKVPIKKEVFMTFHSSWGEIDCDREGKVIEIRGDEYFNEERNYMYDIEKFDLVEYGKFCESKNITMGESDDILSIGFWKKDNTYHEAKKDWRKEMFGEEPPTMLCADSDKHKIVNNIISQLKDIEVDGETMEYILRQVGMEEQMLKQLFAQSTNDEIDYLHDVRNGKG
jgi:hypothetical protein